MGYVTRVTAGLAFAALLSAQTAEELVNKNLTAHGGVEKLKAIHSLRMTGKMQQGSFSVQLGLDKMCIRDRYRSGPNWMTASNPPTNAQPGVVQARSIQ